MKGKGSDFNYRLIWNARKEQRIVFTRCDVAAINANVSLFTLPRLHKYRDTIMHDILMTLLYFTQIQS